MIHVTLFDAEQALVSKIAQDKTVPTTSMWKNVVDDEASFRAYPRFLYVEEGGAQSLLSKFDGAFVRMRGSYQTSKPGAREGLLKKTNGIYAVFCYARGGLDDEFNSWYDRIHMPAAMALGVYSEATRYRLSGRPGDPFVAPYLSIYETPDDPKASFNRWLQFRSKWAQDPDWGRLLGFIGSGGFARWS
ncbi:MAG: hypothetical protein ACKVSF_12470 [Alphaproteobacteria bacterium]